MPTITVDRLDKSYGDVRALREMSFELRPGEIFGFVGSNGAGKSTTMRIVLGVLAADGGRVLRDGVPLDRLGRQRIGYMPEERGLYPRMKVGDQLVYLARLHGLSTAQARAAMERWTTTLGIADRAGDEILRLSLGNQQRVQLAAALVHDPEVLVLDEPFSGLDPVAVDVMSTVLRERADAGAPVIFSSHQLELVERLSDRVGIVQAGRMVAVGGLDELRTTTERRWVVDGAPPTAWAAAVPAARVVSAEPSARGTRTVVEVADPSLADVDQALLRAALAAGPVHELTVHRPSLVELYRGVVLAPEAQEVAA